MGDMQKPVVAQMIVDIVDQDRKRDSSEQFLDVTLRLATVDPQGIDDLCVGVFGGVVPLGAE